MVIKSIKQGFSLNKIIKRQVHSLNLCIFLSKNMYFKLTQLDISFSSYCHFVNSILTNE